MADDTNKPDSTTPRRPLRWLRWLAALVALPALALAVALAVDWLLTPGPGTLAFTDLREEFVPHPVSGIDVLHGEPILLRVPDRELRAPLSVRRLVNGVALPLAVSASNWERAPDGYLGRPFAVSEARLFALEPPIARFVGDTDLKSPDGGRDCLTEVPLDGGPARRRCHSPSLDVLNFTALHVVDSDVYYGGEWLEHDATALAVAAADGTWRRLDQVGHDRFGPSGVGTIVHDRDGIYWSTDNQVRRVDRKSGAVRTVFWADRNTLRSLQPQLAVVGPTLLVATAERLVPGAQAFPIYTVDPKGEIRASAASPLAKLDFLPSHMTTDGVAVYGADGSRIWRLDLNGRMQNLASPEDEFAVLDLTVSSDHVLYLAMGLNLTMLPAGEALAAAKKSGFRESDFPLRTYKVWSVPK